MNLYFRCFYFLLLGVLRSRTQTSVDETRTSFRVLPNDLDLNLHMNNGRYLTILDLARIDYLGKSGLLKVCLGRKWFPILGSAEIKFFRPLNLWQRYEITTRLESWDEKWFVFSHRFEIDGKVVAQSSVRGLFRGLKGNISVAQIFEALGEKHH